MGRLPPSERRDGIESSYTGPARASGSAGTGKTVVALRRALWLARVNPSARVADRVEVSSLDALGLRLHHAQTGPEALASRDHVRAPLREVFLGGKSYVPLFCELTSHVLAGRVVPDRSAKAPDGPGCRTVGYRTAAETNWYYLAVRELTAGALHVCGTGSVPADSVARGVPPPSKPRKDDRRER